MNGNNTIYMEIGGKTWEILIFEKYFQELCVSPNLCGVGGVCQIKLPWKQWNDRSWFLYAMATISLNPSYMKKILPGHMTFEQSFSKNYCGKLDSWALVSMSSTQCICPVFVTEFNFPTDIHYSTQCMSSEAYSR